MFNFGLTRRDGAMAFTDDQLRLLLQGTHTSAISEAGIRTALGSSLHLTFMTMLVASLGIVALALMRPKEGLASRIGSDPKAAPK
ncbi:MAG: hypothetical protein NVS3B2_18390 [Ramlibacter sp.]